MNPRRAAFLIGKITFAVVVVAWLFHKVDAARVWNDVRQASIPTAIFGILLLLLTVIIAGWRWHLLLRIFGVGIPVGSLICIAQVGQFFSMFMPGPTGDDLTRMLYISRLAPGHVGEACTSVVFDRLIGLASVLFLALFCIPFHWNLLSQTRETHLLSVGVLWGGAAVCVAGLLFSFSNHRTTLGFFARLSRLVPQGKCHDELLRINCLLRTNRFVVAKVFGAAVGTQLVLCVVYKIAGSAVGIHAPLSAWFGFVPIVIAANAFPVTVAGIGVREYLLVLFLRVLDGVQGEAALAASFLVLAMTLAICLLGGIVYILYRPSAAQRK